MQPTIGRVVIAQSGTAPNNNADVCPAVISRVFGERPDGSWTVNVRALYDGSEVGWLTSVVLFDTEDQAREYGVGGCWWPPRA